MEFSSFLLTIKLGCKESYCVTVLLCYCYCPHYVEMSDSLQHSTPATLLQDSVWCPQCRPIQTTQEASPLPTPGIEHRFSGFSARSLVILLFTLKYQFANVNFIVESQKYTLAYLFKALLSASKDPLLHNDI
jgi:hypothetical protein